MNVLTMHARTCSCFRLEGSRHLKLMPRFSGFGLAHVKYIMSTRDKTHRSVSASSWYFSLLSLCIIDRFGELGPVQSALCATLLGPFPGTSITLSIAVHLCSPQDVARPLRARCLFCSTRPSELLSVFAALGPYPIHCMLRLFLIATSGVAIHHYRSYFA